MYYGHQIKNCHVFKNITLTTTAVSSYFRHQLCRSTFMIYDGVFNVAVIKPFMSIIIIMYLYSVLCTVSLLCQTLILLMLRN